MGCFCGDDSTLCFNAYKSIISVNLSIKNKTLNPQENFYLISTSSIQNYINILKDSNVLNYLDKPELKNLENNLKDHFKFYKIEKNFKFYSNFKECESIMEFNLGNEFIIVDKSFFRTTKNNNTFNILKNNEVKLIIDKKENIIKVKFLSNKILEIKNIETIFYKFLKSNNLEPNNDVQKNSINNSNGNIYILHGNLLKNNKPPFGQTNSNINDSKKGIGNNSSYNDYQVNIISNIKNSNNNLLIKNQINNNNNNNQNITQNIIINKNEINKGNVSKTVDDNNTRNDNKDINTNNKYNLSQIGNDNINIFENIPEYETQIIKKDPKITNNSNLANTNNNPENINNNSKILNTGEFKHSNNNKDSINNRSSEINNVNKTIKNDTNVGGFYEANYVSKNNNSKNISNIYNSNDGGFISASVSNINNKNNNNTGISNKSNINSIKNNYLNESEGAFIEASLYNSQNKKEGNNKQNNNLGISDGYFIEDSNYGSKVSNMNNK